ncbi:UDP-N-acetylmuramoyl-L-alanyl-D-glutamate--2,6-diaminopimelate ligase [bacterium]|nr:UDP-N-acetylmuramoyl-L-alanyl-D-glutamate--2,6-diaminopimelate ligase [bacterium]
MVKSLRELTAPLVVGGADVPEVAIRSVTTDSRTVTPGALFIAISGTAFEGHDYIAPALAAGAVAVVIEKPEVAARVPAGFPVVCVDNSRRAAAVIADRFWGHPSGALNLVAVTGTNGKTTSVHLLEAIFQAAGHRTGMIGTLGRRVGDSTVVASRTTPDAVELQALLARMRDEGVTHVAMELSSHAIDLDRAWSCSFAGALYTNLSPDHLDWHHDLETYRQSKARLFTDYADMARPDHEMVGAINTDDPNGALIAAEAHCRVVSYGLSPTAMVRAEAIERSARGSRLQLATPDFRRPLNLQLVGQFNVMNALGCAACAYGLGLPEEAIVAGLEGLAGVPGRLEKVDRGQDFVLLVDYAHTPEALENVLQTARELQPRRLICLFGCGGDRDRTKRPVMGRAVTSLADLAIITSDNPRSENPLDIIEEIRQGVSTGVYQVEPDRAAAIRAAVREAQAGDIVLLCGKGHEDYQEFEQGRRVHFDDREVAAAALDEAMGRA